MSSSMKKSFITSSLGPLLPETLPLFSASQKLSLGFESNAIRQSSQELSPAGIPFETTQINLAVLDIWEQLLKNSSDPTAQQEKKLLLHLRHQLQQGQAKTISEALQKLQADPDLKSLLHSARASQAIQHLATENAAHFEQAYTHAQQHSTPSSFHHPGIHWLIQAFRPSKEIPGSSELEKKQYVQFCLAQAFEHFRLQHDQGKQDTLGTLMTFQLLQHTMQQKSAKELERGIQALQGKPDWGWAVNSFVNSIRWDEWISTIALPLATSRLTFSLGARAATALIQRFSVGSKVAQTALHLGTTTTGFVAHDIAYDSARLGLKETFNPDHLQKVARRQALNFAFTLPLGWAARSVGFTPSALGLARDAELPLFAQRFNWGLQQGGQFLGTTASNSLNYYLDSGQAPNKLHFIQGVGSFLVFGFGQSGSSALKLPSIKAPKTPPLKDFIPEATRTMNTPSQQQLSSWGKFFTQTEHPQNPQRQHALGKIWDQAIHKANLFLHRIDPNLPVEKQVFQFIQSAGNSKVWGYVALQPHFSGILRWGVGNCSAKVKLCMALFQDSKAKELLRGSEWIPGVLKYTEHVEAALFHPNKRLTFNLMTGAYTQNGAPADLYHPEILLHGSLPHAPNLGDRRIFSFHPHQDSETRKFGAVYWAPPKDPRGTIIPYVNHQEAPMRKNRDNRVFDPVTGESRELGSPLDPRHPEISHFGNFARERPFLIIAGIPNNKKPTPTPKTGDQVKYPRSSIAYGGDAPWFSWGRLTGSASGTTRTSPSTPYTRVRDSSFLAMGAGLLAVTYKECHEETLKIDGNELSYNIYSVRPKLEIKNKASGVELTNDNISEIEWLELAEDPNSLSAWLENKYSPQLNTVQSLLEDPLQNFQEMNLATLDHTSSNFSSRKLKAHLAPFLTHSSAIPTVETLENNLWAWIEQNPNRFLSYFDKLSMERQFALLGFFSTKDWAFIEKHLAPAGPHQERPIDFEKEFKDRPRFDRKKAAQQAEKAKLLKNNPGENLLWIENTDGLGTPLLAPKLPEPEIPRENIQTSAISDQTFLILQGLIQRHTIKIIPTSMSLKQNGYRMEMEPRYYSEKMTEIYLETLRKGQVGEAEFRTFAFSTVNLIRDSFDEPGIINPSWDPLFNIRQNYEPFSDYTDLRIALRGNGFDDTNRAPLLWKNPDFKKRWQEDTTFRENFKNLKPSERQEIYQQYIYSRF